MRNYRTIASNKSYLSSLGSGQSQIIVPTDGLENTINIAPTMTSNTTPAPYVVTGSATVEGSIWGAFDKSQSSRWSTSVKTDAFLQIDLNTPKNIVGFSIQARIGSTWLNQTPKNFKLEGSNDAANWVILSFQSNQTNWKESERRRYGVSEGSSYRYYKFTSLLNNGAIDGTTVAELELLNFPPTVTLPTTGNIAPTMTSAITPEPFVVNSSSFYPSWDGWKVFDKVVNADLGFSGTTKPAWVQIDIVTTRLINSFSIRSRGLSQWQTQSPKDFTLQASNDGSNFTTIATVTNQTGWLAFERRVFPVDAGGVAYRYFKINFTANNGETNTSLSEIELLNI